MTLESTIPLLDLRYALAVRVGNVLVPAKDVESTLAIHCEALHCIPDDGSRFLSLAGSTTLIRYKGIEFALSTKHQLKGNDLQTLSLPGTRRDRFVSSNGYLCVERPEALEFEDKYDVAALRFDESVAEGSVASSKFFSLTCLSSVGRPDVPVAYLVYGHAYADQVFENECFGGQPGLKTIKLVKRVCLCEEEGKSNDGSLLRLKTIGGSPFDSDGFSGGAVFAVTPTEDGSNAAKFAGIICRGGTGTTFHAIKASILIKWLDGMIVRLDA